MSGLKFDLQKTVTNDLTFKPQAKEDYIPVTTIESIKFNITEYDVNDKDGNPSTSEWAGMEVPSLMITFKQVIDDGRRIFKLKLSPVHTIKNNGDATDMNVLIDLYTAQYETLRHIHDGFAGDVNYKEITSLPELIFDGTTQEHLESTSKFYKAFSDIFNSVDGKTPVFNDKNDNPLKKRLKLVAKRFTTSNGGKAVALNIPSYIGKGWFAPYLVVKGKLETTLEFTASQTWDVKAGVTPNAATNDFNSASPIDTSNTVEDSDIEEMIKQAQGK